MSIRSSRSIRHVLTHRSRHFTRITWHIIILRGHIYCCHSFVCWILFNEQKTRRFKFQIASRKNQQFYLNETGKNVCGFRVLISFYDFAWHVFNEPAKPRSVVMSKSIHTQGLSGKQANGWRELHVLKSTFWGNKLLEIKVEQRLLCWGSGDKQQMETTFLFVYTFVVVNTQFIWILYIPFD